LLYGASLACPPAALDCGGTKRGASSNRQLARSPWAKDSLRTAPTLQGVLFDPRHYRGAARGKWRRNSKFQPFGKHMVSEWLSAEAQRVVFAPEPALATGRVFRTAGVDDGRHGDVQGVGDIPPALPLGAHTASVVASEYAPG